MVHSYIGGVAREGRPPKFDVNINIYTPAEVVLCGNGSCNIADGDKVCVGDTLFGGETPVYATVSGVASVSDGKVVIKSDGENKPSDTLVAASKSLEEFTHDEIAIEANRYAVYDSKQGAMLGDMIKSCQKGQRIVVNCCEGYFDGFASAADIMADVNALVGGCTVLLYALDAAKAIVCCDKTAKKLIKALEAATKGRRDITIAIIETRYPISDRTLLGAIYGKGVVPQKPIDSAKHFVVTSGAVTQLYRSFVSGMPQVTKTFALCREGEAPKTVSAPIGTCLNEILTQYQIDNADDTATVAGNPINGTEVDRFTYAVNAGTDMIRVFTKHEYLETDCISCGRCNLACPMGLNVKNLVKSGKLPHKALCNMCGACEFICPSRIRIMDRIQDLISTAPTQTTEIEQKEDVKND